MSYGFVHIVIQRSDPDPSETLALMILMAAHPGATPLLRRGFFSAWRILRIFTTPDMVHKGKGIQSHSEPWFLDVSGAYFISGGRDGDFTFDCKNGFGALKLMILVLPT